jgi:hypothetical protein
MRALSNSKRGEPFASPVPNVQHVDPLLILVAHEVNVALRFFEQDALELRAPIRRAWRARTAHRLEMLDRFQHFLEEKLRVISVLPPMFVDSDERALGTLR